MKALSVREPWASLIAGQWKGAENRSWCPAPAQLKVGEDLLICAAKTPDFPRHQGRAQREWEALLDHLGGVEASGLPPAYCTFRVQPGHALCVVRYLGADRDMRTLYDVDGEWHWRLLWRFRLQAPFPVNGQLGIFHVDDARVRAAQ